MARTAPPVTMEQDHAGLDDWAMLGEEGEEPFVDITGSSYCTPSKAANSSKGANPEEEGWAVVGSSPTDNGTGHTQQSDAEGARSLGQAEDAQHPAEAPQPAASGSTQDSSSALQLPAEDGAVGEEAQGSEETADGAVASAPLVQALVQAGPVFSEPAEDYVEAKVDKVSTSDSRRGRNVSLKLMDGKGLVLPIYIGDAEGTALLREMNREPLTRPMTHDLLKNCLEGLGYQLAQVRITAFTDNTYYASLCCAPRDGPPGGRGVEMDARPSDAVNLAVRCSAPVFVHKDVAAKMGRRLA